MDEVVVLPPTNNEQVSSTTIEVTATTTTPTPEKFLKEVVLTTQNYFEFPDNVVLAVKKINDSRCAPNVNCIWAGNVVVTMNIKKEKTLNADFDLKFGPGTEATSYVYNGYTIKIKSVAPDKGPSSEIVGQKDYQITVQIFK